MRPLSEDQHSRLVEVSSKRYFNRIELYELYLWLDNFEPDEYDMAITLLEHVDFYREKDFVSLLGSAIEKLALDINTARFHFLPLGNPGKSGDIVIYQLQKLFAPYQGKSTFYNYSSEIKTDHLQQNDYVILVDDFIGSGNTADEFIQTIPNKDALLAYPRLCIICGVIMKSGKGMLERKYTKTFGVKIAAGDEKYKAFEKRHTPFGGYVRMKRMRDFCYKYGIGLYRKAPLGFKNTQSLVIIEHSSPNDSIPLLWSNKEIKGKPWTPLAPRNYNIAAERACLDRQENNRWISMVRKKVGVDTNDDVKDMFSGDNYTLIMILRLLMERKTESVIANTLGLTFDDMQLMKEKGVECDYWDENWEVSDYAMKQYEEAVAYFKRENREKNELAAERADERNMIYIPETFRGLK